MRSDGPSTGAAQDFCIAGAACGKPCSEANAQPGTIRAYLDRFHGPYRADTQQKSVNADGSGIAEGPHLTIPKRSSRDMHWMTVLVLPVPQRSNSAPKGTLVRLSGAPSLRSATTRMRCKGQSMQTRTMPLQDLQHDAQDAQLHIGLAGVLVQRLQGHQQHVLGGTPVLACRKWHRRSMRGRVCASRTRSTAGTFQCLVAAPAAHACCFGQCTDDSSICLSSHPQPHCCH